MAAERRRLLIGAEAARLRRELGPTAWMVLEELLACSTGSSGACRAEVSVRSLGHELGLSKDTVARALGRLRRAGFVTADQSRETTGVFAVGCYRIKVPTAIGLSDGTTEHHSVLLTTSRPPTAAKRPRPTRRDGSQLALAIDA